MLNGAYAYLAILCYTFLFLIVSWRERIKVSKTDPSRELALEIV